MKFRNSNLVNAVFLSLLLINYSASYCFSQNKEQREPKNRKSQSGRNNDNPKKSTPMPIVNGNIVLGSPTDNSITANVILEKDGEAFIEYSTNNGKYDNKTPVIRSHNGEPFEILIENLLCNTVYYYRLNYRSSKETEFRQSPESWFATQRKSKATYSFGVQGDSHPEREGKMFNPILYNQNVEKAYKLQRYYLGNCGRNVPLFLVNGNHEQAAKYLLDGTEKNAAVIAANARKKYFQLPEPGKFYSGDNDTVAHIGFLKDYYSFEWGNALFVVIDPYWHSEIAVDNQSGSYDKMNRKDPWGISLGEEQYKRFKHTLESTKAKYKFVFSHHVLGTGRGGVERAKLLEWGGFGQNGTWQFDQYRSLWKTPIHQLMAKNKVTIFFQGHDHLFAKQDLDGIVYQLVPQPGAMRYGNINSADEYGYLNGKILNGPGYLRIKMEKTKATIEFVQTSIDSNHNNKEVLFTYSIQIK